MELGLGSGSGLGLTFEEGQRGDPRRCGLGQVVTAGERRLAPGAALAAALDDERRDVVAVVIGGRGFELQVARLECRLRSKRGHLVLPRVGVGVAPSQLAERVGTGLARAAV